MRYEAFIRERRVSKKVLTGDKVLTLEVTEIFLLPIFEERLQRELVLLEAIHSEGCSVLKVSKADFVRPLIS
jgi:hypothetical protein